MSGCLGNHTSLYLLVSLYIKPNINVCSSEGKMPGEGRQLTTFQRKQEMQENHYQNNPLT